MSDSSLIFPDGFEQYAWELDSKGRFSDGGIFFEPNLVVVPTVTPQNMEKAAVHLVKQASAGSLLAEQSRNAPQM
jgi:hypothetical protein